MNHKEAQDEARIKVDPCEREYEALLKTREGQLVPAKDFWKRAWELGIKSITSPSEKLYVGWEGYYIKGGGEVYWWCRIIAFDDGQPVIRTRKGYYHRRPLGIYKFYKKVSQGAITK